MYTLRSMDETGSNYQLVKWPECLEGHKQPLDIYHMNSSGYCGCPSPSNPCKHQVIKKALLDYATSNQCFLHTLAYQNGEVIKLGDF